MAVGKNKKLGKKRKGTRKIADPFSKKEWYDIKAPSSFAIRQVGKTVVTKTQGTKNSKDSLMGRVFESSIGDLKPNSEDDAYRKFYLKVEEVVGQNCLTNFYGMNLSTDKLRSLVKKYHSLIEAHVDVKTADGYLLRLFAIGFTSKRQNQIKKTSYAQSAQCRSIRKKMVDIMTKHASESTLSELVDKLITESIGLAIHKACEAIYPLQAGNVLIRKVKMLRAPKTDMAALLALHGGADAAATSASSTAVDLGKPVEKKE